MPGFCPIMALLQQILAEKNVWVKLVLMTFMNDNLVRSLIRIKSQIRASEHIADCLWNVE